MSYVEAFQSGHLVLPARLLFEADTLFGSMDDFLVWQFFFYQNTSSLEELAPSTVAKATGKSLSEVNQSISNLQAKGLLEFKTIELSGEIEMIFDAMPALEKLDSLANSKTATAPESELLSNPTKVLVGDFERELGRLLSPFEIEDLQKSLQEGLSAEVITAALREAVFNGKPHWKYIQAILRNWRREGITTLAQIEAKQAERELNQQPQAGGHLADYQAALSVFQD